jgi:hypothetical protein
VKARAARSKPLFWIEIGSMSGLSIALPSAALRAADLRLLGSGQGSVATADIVAELPALAEQISAHSFSIEPLATPLEDVESAWQQPTAPGRRIVFVP